MNKQDGIEEKLFSQQFDDFCNQYLSEDLIFLERSRKKYLKGIKVVEIMGLIFAIFLIIIMLQSIEGLYLQAIFFFLIALAPFCVFALFLDRKYQEKVKFLIVNKMFEFIGDFKYIKLSKNEKNQEQYYLKSLRLFETFDLCNFDDCINGSYNDLNIEIREIELEINRKNSRNKAFSGLYIKVPSLKTFNGFITISAGMSCVSPEEKTFRSGKNYGQIVSLEYPDFKDYYTVFSNDQIEARYILTPSFMEKLIDLKNKKISISFENGYIHISKPQTINMFEIDINKPATDLSNYKKAIMDLFPILSLIDTLKLDQNIGL